MGDNNIKHYGIIGMHWGVRRAAEGSHGERVNRTLAKIKSIRTAGENKRWDRMGEAIKVEESNLNSLRNKKLSEIDASPSPRIKKFIDKKKYEDKHLNLSIDAIDRIETQHISKSDAIRKARKSKLAAAEKKIMDEWEKEADFLYETKVKTLRFPKDIVMSLRLDNDLRKKYVEKLLEEELKIEEEINKDD